MQTKFDRLRIAAGLAAAILSVPPGTAQTPSLTTLYSFQGGSDGAGPYGGVALVDGSLYGTTYHGGAGAYCQEEGGCGAVFQLAPPSTGGGAWTESVIHSFVDAYLDGYFPAAGVTASSGGALYGTTVLGGNQGSGGTVFELDPPSSDGGAWTETLLWSFVSEGVAQRNPAASVVVGPGGQLFGTTVNGGSGCARSAYDCGGTVFALEPPVESGGAWADEVLHVFGGSATAANPYSAVTSGAQGSLYGTAYEGGWGPVPPCGPLLCGWVFELTPPSSPGGAWTETEIYSFLGPPSDGSNPYAALIPGPSGNFFGTTEFGGSGACANYTSSAGCGVVFELTPPASPGAAWTETVIYNFTGKNGDGAYPIGGLLLGTNGLLYGTTYGGGNLADCPPFTSHAVAGCGTIFQLTPPASPGGAWTETILHAFNNTDGALPRATLTPGKGGVLYGTTYGGGAHGYGTVFQLKP